MASIEHSNFGCEGESLSSFHRPRPGTDRGAWQLRVPTHTWAPFKDMDSDSRSQAGPQIPFSQKMPGGS